LNGDADDYADKCSNDSPCEMGALIGRKKVHDGSATNRAKQYGNEDRIVKSAHDSRQRLRRRIRVIGFTKRPCSTGKQRYTAKPQSQLFCGYSFSRG
jgi:hypothetical protein